LTEKTFPEALRLSDGRFRRPVIQTTVNEMDSGTKFSEQLRAVVQSPFSEGDSSCRLIRWARRSIPKHLHTVSPHHLEAGVCGCLGAKCARLGS
jgi:hypothetical protein